MFLRPPQNQLGNGADSVLLSSLGFPTGDLAEETGTTVCTATGVPACVFPHFSILLEPLKQVMATRLGEMTCHWMASFFWVIQSAGVGEPLIVFTSEVSIYPTESVRRNSI